jgi:hypothetical protein
VAYLEGVIENLEEEREKNKNSFALEKKEYQKELGTEIVVNEAIRNRQEHFISLLKKELIFA